MVCPLDSRLFATAFFIKSAAIGSTFAGKESLSKLNLNSVFGLRSKYLLHFVLGME